MPGLRRNHPVEDATSGVPAFEGRNLHVEPMTAGDLRHSWREFHPQHRGSIVERDALLCRKVRSSREARARSGSGKLPRSSQHERDRRARSGKRVAGDHETMTLVEGDGARVGGFEIEGLAGGVDDLQAVLLHLAAKPCALQGDVDREPRQIPMPAAKAGAGPGGSPRPLCQHQLPARMPSATCRIGEGRPLPARCPCR
jgi:hypothetical protein